MLQAYKDYWKGYVDFKGKTGRKNYWLVVLMSLIVTFVIGVIVSLIFGSDMMVQTSSYTNTFNMASTSGIIMFCWALVNVLPDIAIDIRRLHDIGKSGWWLLISLVPFVGSIILLVFFLTKGEK